MTNNNQPSKERKDRNLGFKKEKEFDEKVLEIKRVTRVVAGGKRLSFRTVVVLGDYRGRVGLGVGKGKDVAESIRKGRVDAEKHIIKFPLVEERTIPYDVEAKYSAARVKIKPAEKGHGLVAGGSVRTVLQLAGVKDISAKILGRTTNKIANSRAAILALTKLNQLKQQDN